MIACVIDASIKIAQPSAGSEEACEHGGRCHTGVARDFESAVSLLIRMHLQASLSVIKGQMEQNPRHNEELANWSEVN